MLLVRGEDDDRARFGPMAFCARDAAQPQKPARPRAPLRGYAATPVTATPHHAGPHPATPRQATGGHHNQALPAAPLFLLLLRSRGTARAVRVLAPAARRRGHLLPIPSLRAFLHFCTDASAIANVTLMHRFQKATPASTPTLAATELPSRTRPCSHTHRWRSPPR